MRRALLSARGMNHFLAFLILQTNVSGSQPPLVAHCAALNHAPMTAAAVHAVHAGVSGVPWADGAVAVDAPDPHPPGGSAAAFAPARPCKSPQAPSW